MKYFIAQHRKLARMVAFCLISGALSAQNIQIFIHIQPNLPPYLSDWEIDPNLTNIQLLTNLQEPMLLEVQVLVHEFSRGTVFSASSVPIQALPGPFQLNINNIEFLAWQSLEYDPIFEQDLAQTGRLPDGDYEICVYVRGFQDPGGTVLGESCASFSIISHSPPVMIYPYDEVVLTEPTPLFQWSYGGHAPGVTYTLNMVEVLPTQSAEEALETNQNIFSLSGISQPIYLFGQADALFRPCFEYAVWVDVDQVPGIEQFSGPLRSEAASFYWQTGGEPSITPISPGTTCIGNVASAIKNTEVTFEWTATGAFSSFNVVTCDNPCGTYNPGPGIPIPTGGTSTPTEGGGNKPTPTEGGGNKPTPGTSGPQYPDVPTVDERWERLNKIVADAICGMMDLMEEPPQFISNALVVNEIDYRCEPQSFSITLDFTGIIEPGAAFTWYVVGVTSANTAVSSPTFCDRYSPPGMGGEMPEEMPCPYSPRCQIELEEIPLPRIAGGLSPATKVTKPILRDQFVALEAGGVDYDYLVMKCEPKDDCKEKGSERLVLLTGRVRFEWEITSDKGEFKKLGCLPEGVKKDVGEHVILLPPYIPLPDSDAMPNKETVTIELKIIDDNPTQPKDADSICQIKVEFTRTKSMPDHYGVVITGPEFTEKQADTPTPKLEKCKPEEPVWDMKTELEVPTIKLPDVPDSNKMVVGQWIILEAADDRDSDVLKELKCTSEACEKTKEEDRKYEDDVRWNWTIKEGRGGFILGPKGRFVIYEAPMALDDKEAKRKIIIEVEVSNPSTLQALDNKPAKGKIELTVHQAGVRLSYPAADWLPTDYNDVQLTSELVYCTDAKQEGTGANRKIKKTWMPALAHMCRIHFFELDSVSRESGVCLNYPRTDLARTCVDYHWESEDEHEADRPDNESDTKCTYKEHFQSARTQKPVKTYIIKVHSNDFGGYTDVSSYANHTHKNDGELKNPRYESIPVTNDSAPKHPEGMAKKKVYWDNRVTVPVDIDENYIPDNGWIATVGGARIHDRVEPKTDWDELPNGDGTDGDGFSAYEEYRGFKIFKPDNVSMHIRLHTNTKDLFVHNPDRFALGVFRTVTSLAVHEITNTQYDGDTKRLVNFNHHTAHVDNQHGLYIRNATLDAGFLGIAQPLTGNWPSPPNYNKYVHVDKTDITNWAKTKKINVDNSINYVVAHELSHACNVYHHGEHPNGGQNFDVVHGLRSGDVACIMRYNNVGKPLANPNPELIGTILCQAQAGTGFNAGGRNFGDAAQSHRVNTGIPLWRRGDCLHQLRIKWPLSTKPDYPTRHD